MSPDEAGPPRVICIHANRQWLSSMFGPNPIRERIQIVDAYCTTRHHTTRLSRRDIEAHALAEEERNETCSPKKSGLLPLRSRPPSSKASPFHIFGATCMMVITIDMHRGM